MFKFSANMSESEKVRSDIGAEFADPGEFNKGLEVEKEHGPDGPGDGKFNISNGDPEVEGQIAAAHLKELPDYYTKLDRMEKKSFAMDVANAVTTKLLAMEKLI